MAFYNKKKSDFMKQTIFSNTFEPQFVNPRKKYYSFIEIAGKDHYFEYEGVYRVEAEQHFIEQSRLHGGKFNGKVFAYKN